MVVRYERTSFPGFLHYTEIGREFAINKWVILHWNLTLHYLLYQDVVPRGLFTLEV